MTCSSRQWRIFGRSETKPSSFLRQAWSGIGFTITWQFISSYTISTVHLYWEINVPLSDFIAVHSMMNLIFIFTEHRLIYWCLSQQDPTLTSFLKDYTILHQFSNGFEQNTILFHFSGFVFLRLICPAILNPRMFNIISGDYVLQIKSVLYAAETWNHCSIQCRKIGSSFEYHVSSQVIHVIWLT